MDTSESATTAVAALGGTDFASEDTLLSSVAFLRNTLAGLGFCQDLNLLSTDPADVVATCNTIYGLLLQHQKDCKFKEQLKSEMHRVRLDAQAKERERLRLDSRLQAKEREIGGLLNKVRQAEEGAKREVGAVRKECDELGRKLVAQERRLVQLQHEVKRKEKEYERLQEKLTHYLADKKKHEKSVLEQAGKVTAQLAVSQAVRRTDEGLKAVVAAYEQKQGELAKENKDLKASLASLQSEYKDLVNRQIQQAQAEAAGAAAPLVEDSFIQAVPSMSEEELRAELGARIKKLTRRLNGLEDAQPSDQLQSPQKQRLRGDLQVAHSVVREQERLLSVMLSALRSAQQSKEAQHAADVKRLAQHYQAQLAAAEGEIQRARDAEAAAAAQAAGLEREALQEQVASLQAQLESERAERAAQAEALAASLEAERLKLAASVQQERVALQLQAQEVIDSQRRFEVLQRTYQDLMRKWAPGVGAGLFLERALSRKAADLTAAEIGGAGGGTIAAARPVSLVVA